MTPSLILQFVTSPISALQHFAGNIRAAMTLQKFGLVLRLGSALLAAEFAREWLVEVYTLLAMVLYGLHMLVLCWMLVRHA